MAAAFVVLAACSSGDAVPPPRPAPPGSSTTVADVTVRGVVATVSASARVVALAPVVDGVANLALTIDAEIVRPDGVRVAVGDIAPGARVEATGQRSTPGTLLTRRLVVL
ncbi:MAG TPA: hypothetical protein VL337_18435 [Acidimicrobiales bacterium]|nr:hypothetical protein [Acidimicrobiales bacterium]